MSETATILVEDKSEKPGTSAKGNAWTKHAIRDANGEWYSTFDGSVIPSDIKGKRAVITYEVDGKFKNLLSLEVEKESPLPSSQKPDGDADWDIIGLRKTRCHLWGAFMAGDAMQSLIAMQLRDKSDIKQSELVHNLLAAGRDLVRGAEIDIYHRDPAAAQEDVPF